ncbi:hypothetical protein BC938DRAFT_480112 [Jimgerdemannia flammicorona]|uniref:NB-ARC domain-containing protein n=1 Tax=Jimgerdemannia flammicorona TaxID=994334 RepID=A0A433QXG6_9FUNG|nr:hypothetical protein BC938DRAFT_480112 [Jimgerdemannia flammicorona]
MKTELDKSPLPGPCGILALKGMGGIGKTQLMLHYCYIHFQSYKYAFWLEVGDWRTTVDSFHKLAINLSPGEDIAAEKTSGEKIIEGVRDWLEKNEGWLLLLDNVNYDTDTEVFKYLPRIGGHIILTTREPIPSEVAKVIKVDKMKHDEAIAMLLDGSTMDSVNEELNIAKEIITQLDCMPFALHLARAYIETSDITLRDYADKQKKEVKDSKEDPRRYFLTIDRLVQKAIYDSMEDKKKLQWAKNIATALNNETKSFNSLNPYDPPTRVIMETYLSHIQHFVTWLDLSRKPLKSKDLHNLLIRAVDYLRGNGAYSEAEELALLSLEVSNMVNRQDHPDTAISLYHLAVIYEGLGNYDEAMRVQNEALGIREIEFGINGPDTATSMNHLGKLYMRRGEHGKAKKHHKRALEVFEKKRGPDHPDTAMSLYDLAGVYYSQNDFTKAEKLHQRALTIREKVLGSEHPDTAMSQIELAQVYKNQGKCDEADKLHKRALEILELTFGKDHPHTKALNGLAGKALELEHPGTATSPVSANRDPGTSVGNPAPLNNHHEHREPTIYPKSSNTNTEKSSVNRVPVTEANPSSGNTITETSFGNQASASKELKPSSDNTITETSFGNQASATKELKPSSGNTITETSFENRASAKEVKPSSGNTITEPSFGNRSPAKESDNTITETSLGNVAPAQRLDDNQLIPPGPKNMDNDASPEKLGPVKQQDQYRDQEKQRRGAANTGNEPSLGSPVNHQAHDGDVKPRKICCVIL